MDLFPSPACWVVYLHFDFICLVHIDGRSVEELDIGEQGGEEIMQFEKEPECLEESPEAKVILDISNLRKVR